MTRAVLAPAAERDLVDAVTWIAQENPAAARALRDAIDRAATALGAHPLIGTERPDIASPPVRFLTLAGFPYVIVYLPTRTPPLIVRVLHGARDLPDALGA